MSEENGATTKDILVNIVGRFIRKHGLAERTGADAVLDQLEMTPIPMGAVIPIANTIMKASILDEDRIRNKIPLAYVWLEAFLLGQKGAKKQFAFMLKDLAQVGAERDVEESETGEEGE
jgi:hypothetical protein